MVPRTNNLLRLLALGFGIGAMGTARATEPNNLPSMATVLPGGQLVVHDDLNGNVGRPDTILGLYDPAYSTLMASDDESSPLGNGHASRLLGVPVRSNGSAYFRVTGAPDSTFVSNHMQSGQYSVRYDVRNPMGDLVPEKSFTEYESVSPLSLDNVWMNPSAPPAGFLNWTGFTVDVTVNNVVGPGTGDSLDFFVFTGLAPFATISATITDAEFDALIGIYNNNTLALSSVGGPPTLVGQADAAGNVKIGVTGLGDDTFGGAHALVGEYTLAVAVVPEPATLVLLSTGAALCGAWWLRKRHSIPRDR